MTMTGETRDAVIDTQSVIEAITPEQRALFMADLLDHVCVRCGNALDKFDTCPGCGFHRASDVIDATLARMLNLTPSDALKLACEALDLAGLEDDAAALARDSKDLSVLRRAATLADTAASPIAASLATSAVDAICALRCVNAGTYVLSEPSDPPPPRAT